MLLPTKDAVDSMGSARDHGDHGIVMDETWGVDANQHELMGWIMTLVNGMANTA